MLGSGLIGTATDTLKMPGLQKEARSRDDSSKCVNAMLAMCA